MAPSGSNILPVLIVGAGPAGLVSALFLAESGIHVRIVDKAEAFAVGSRGFGVQPRTFELFQILGVLDEVQKNATPIPTMRAYALPGGVVPVRTWDLYEKSGAEVWPDRPFANGACLSQHLLEDVLRRRLATFGVKVELGKSLVALEQEQDDDDHASDSEAGVVRATIAVVGKYSDSDGTNLEEETIVARYLIGADGARGNSRKLLGLSFQGETRDADGMVWGDVEIAGLTPDFWHIWGKPGCFTIMARPLTPGSGSQFGLGITGQNFDPTDLADPEKVVEFSRRETGRDNLSFGEFTWLSHFRPNMRMVNKFQEGRAFVVGDAAHVHSPTGGQGMNCSVQDASNLAWKLALVLNGVAHPSLLATYDQERLPVITQMLHATSKLYTHTVAKKELSQDAPVEPEISNALHPEKKSGWFKWRNSALEMYGINYRYSSIVSDTRSATRQNMETMVAHAYSGYEGRGSLAAGDRAPEAPGLVSSHQGETTLYRLLRPSMHTILMFGYADADVRDASDRVPGVYVQVFSVTKARRVDATEVLVDRDGHAHACFMIEDRPTIIVVRPDTFVGAILQNPKELEEYFSCLASGGASM